MKWEVQDIPGELSAKIRNMSFVCALLVVCIHCNVSLSVKHDVFWLMQLKAELLEMMNFSQLTVLQEDSHF